MLAASPFKYEDPQLRKYGPMLKGRILILEGHIAAGKSTAGKELTKFLTDLGIKTKFFPEPLIPGLLKLFLSDQKKYAYSFQLAMLVKRQAIYREARTLADQGYFCIIDRSLHGDYCFALMHKNRGNITEQNTLDQDSPTEWGSYLEVLASEEFQKPDYVVYLKVTAKKAIERCKNRDRNGEKAYDIKYFEELGKIYDSTIPQSPSLGYLVLDWNEDRCGCKSRIVTDILDNVKKVYDSW